MWQISPLGTILIGFVMVVIGVVIPFGMIIGLIETGFFLAFFSYFCSTIGLLLGMIGAMLYQLEGEKEDTMF